MNSRFSGSCSRNCGLTSDDWRYALEVTMSRTMCLTSQPLSTNSTASQSSNPGCVGHSPCEPVSSSVLERPEPKRRYQRRFTNTRAVSGLSADVSHSAKWSRFARLPFFNTGRKCGTAGSTISPESSIQLPRGSTRIVRGLIRPVTMVRVSLACATSSGETTCNSGSRLVGSVLVPLKVLSSFTSAKNAARL